MIISASRRTDVPAFFHRWFSDCLSAGYVDVSNPFNPEQVRRISLLPEDVEGFVFWTKYPLPFFSCLDELDQLGFEYYFQFTLTPYQTEIEPGIPEKKAVTDVFRRLSGRLGPSRVIWRYDPILISGDFDTRYHILEFEKLCRNLEGYTQTVTVSFFQPYRKCLKKTGRMGIYDPDPPVKKMLLQQLSALASSCGISLSVCADSTDYDGIKRSKCIDNAMFRSISGGMPYIRAKHQRDFCQCHESVDIGSYATCRFGCIYCYAS